MIQEERKADEFEPEPKREEVGDAWEVSLMKNPSVWRRNTEEGCQGVLKAVNRTMGEEVAMTAAGAGSDR